MAENQKRPRNADATRAAIEQAARHQFMLQGYSRASLRDIAREAGVDAAMINRYFGSKAGLFDTAVLPHINSDILLEGDFSGFAERAAAVNIAFDPDHKKDFDVILMLLLTMGDADIRPKLTSAIDSSVIAPIADRLDGDDRHMRAALIMALLVGFDAFHRILNVESLAGADRAALGKRLSGLVQNLVDDAGSTT